MNSKDKTVSIIIPAYQESRAITPLLSAVYQVMESLGCDHEVIVVDDGSHDGTGAAASRAGAQVLTHPYNKGYGAALKTGIRHARFQTLVLIDADGQHDPQDIPKLLAERKTYDMVVGARNNMGSSPSWRRPGKLLLKYLANHLTGRNIPDLNSGLRAIDRELALHILPIMPNGFSFSTTSTISILKGGYLVQYVPICVSPRVTGKSTVSANDGLKMLWLIIRIVTLFAPLKIFLPVSTVTLLIGVGFTIQGYLLYGAASVKGLIALLAAVQFFLFGIMVDQLVAIRRGECIGNK